MPRRTPHRPRPFARLVLACLAALPALAGCTPRVGQVVHFDMPAGDPEALGAFYGELYGWGVEKGDNPVPYWLLDTPGTFLTSVHGGLYPKDEGKGELGNQMYVYVDDVAAYLARAERLGATVVTPRTAVPDVGFVAHVRDPEGNVTGMFQWAPDEGRAAWEQENGTRTPGD